MKTAINNLKFSRAQQKDLDQLFEWINDAIVRAQSLSGHTITYEEHTTWFTKKLADKNCYLYIVYEDNNAAGMIRFDIRSDECTISYLVDATRRGKGVGGAMIHSGIEQFKKDSRFNGCAKAIVKNTNIASLRIFEKEGFEEENIKANLICLKKSI